MDCARFSISMFCFIFGVLSVLRELATGLADLGTLYYPNIQTNVFLRAFYLSQIKFHLKSKQYICNCQ